MPNFMQTLADRMHMHRPSAAPIPIGAEEDVGPTNLPASAWVAMWRGLRGHCPRCSHAPLFGRFLKPVLHCDRCRQDWTHQQADDFPAYIAIFVTGHLMAPLIIALTLDTELSAGWMIAIIMPTALILLLTLLQPAKGASIALQWWFGMHSFQKERRAPLSAPPAP